MATRIHAVAAVSLLAGVLACSSQRPPGDLGHADSGAPPDAFSATDGARIDTQGDGAPTGPFLGAGGACTVDLTIHGTLSGTEGTLPAPAPYRPCRLLGGHRYTSVRLSGDGRRVAALTTAGVVIVLDSRTLQRLAVLSRNRGAYTRVAVSGDGTIVAAGSDVDGEVDVWRVADHAVVRAVDLGPTWPSLGGALALSTDGAQVATVSGTSIVVVDVATGRMRSLPASRLATTLFFVDGDRKLAFAGGDYWSAGTGFSRVELIDIETGAVVTLAQHDDIYGVDQLEVSADGNSVLVFGHEELSIWDAATADKRVVPRPEWMGGTVGVLGLSADGTEIATSLSNEKGGRFQRRRASDGAVIDEVRLDVSAGGYAWSSRERLLIGEVWGDAGETRLLAIDTAAPKVLANACAGRPPGRPVGFSADGKRLVVNDAPRVTVFDVETGASLGEQISTGPSFPESLTVSPDGRRVAWTTSDVDVGADMVTKRVYMADAPGGERRLMFQRRSVNYGLAVVFSADSRRLAVVDISDAVLSTIDVQTAARTNEVLLGTSNAWPLAFTSDGDAVVILDDDHGLRTVRWRDGTPVAEVTVLGDYVSGSASGTVVALWKAEANVYRDSALLTTMPGIDDFCFGFIPNTALSGDGSVVGFGYGCSRPSGRQAPHADIRETATGALIQQVAGDLWVFSSDASRFADGAGLVWCR
jgi:WD40 repeat protein